MSRHCASVFFVCVAAFASACTTPSGSSVRLESGVAQDVWSRHIERISARTAIRCTARLAVDGTMRLRAKQALVAERPGRLRVEIHGFLGETLGVLTVDDREYALFQSDRRVVDRGPVDADLLARVVSLAVTPEEIVGLLLGRPVVGGPGNVERGEILPDGSRRVWLSGMTSQGGSMAEFGPDGALARFSRLPADGTRWEAAFSDYRAVGGEWVAHRITVDVGEDTRAVLILRDVELNPTLPADIFQLGEVAPGSA